MRAFGRQLLDDIEQVAHRARQAVEPNHNEDVAGADLANKPGEGRAGPRGAGTMLLDDCVASGRPQLHLLRFRRLLVRGHARIADKPALWSTRGGIARCFGHLESLRDTLKTNLQT